MCLGSRRPLVRDPSIISGGQKVQRIPVRNLKAASLSIIILPDWKVQHDTLRFQTSTYGVISVNLHNLWGADSSVSHTESFCSSADGPGHSVQVIRSPRAAGMQHPANKLRSASQIATRRAQRNCDKTENAESSSRLASHSPMSCRACNKMLQKGY